MSTDAGSEALELSATEQQTPAAAPRPPGTLERGASLGRYTIDGFLGAGGMGEVYAALDPELQRKIAIKILRGNPARPDLGARTRILREAQALARLDHPNIVAIHDVGSVDDRVFVAMQLCSGVSLAAWIGAAAHPWREVCEVFLAAGRGLEAAHAVGIVHRDFKPGNVMVDGQRVVVLDFGLARNNDEVARETPEPTPFDVGLTMTGALVGTLAYMSPEQLAGEPATERSDQWAFCVSMFEALFGRRPFLGANALELRRAVEAEPVVPPDRRGSVPRWLTAIVLRGLRVDPAHRHPSMTSLLRALARAPRRRLRLALACAVALAGGGAAAWVARPRSEPPCAGAAGGLGGVWDAAARARMEAAFSATGRKFAADTFARAAVLLDGYAARWATMRVEACEATLVRGEQSPRLMDARMACLDRRRDELRAVIEAFSHDLDPSTAGAAIDAAARLTDLGTCADREALEAAVPLPEDPAARASIASLSADLDKADASLATGKRSSATTLVDEVERAAASTYRPLRARALLVRARQRTVEGHPELAWPLVDSALEAAVADKDDKLAVQAWIMLFEVRLAQGADNEIIQLALPARAALMRAGDAPDARVHLEAAVADALGHLGRYDDAAELFDRTIALARGLGPPRRALAVALTRSVSVFEQRRDVERWRLRAEEALRATEAAWGPHHYRMMKPLGLLANAATEAGKYDEALALHRRALAVAEDSIGLDNVQSAAVLVNEGVLENKRQRPQDAMPLFERALAIMERLGAKNPELAGVLLNMAEACVKLERLDEARVLLERAQRLAEGLPPDHPRYAFIYNLLYSLAQKQGHWEEALTHAQAGLTLLERKVPPTSPRLLVSLSRVGDANAELHHFAEALAAYERALAIVEGGVVPPGDAAEIRWALAQLLVRAHGDRPRACRLAREAERVFAEVRYQDLHKRVVEWLARGRCPR